MLLLHLYLMLLACAVFAVALSGRLVTALAGLLAALALAHALLARGEGGAPAWLLCRGPDRWELVHRGGEREAVELGAGSLLLGAGVVLVLQGRRVHRLWLSRGNVTPVALAALRRQLSRAEVRRRPRQRKFLYWLE